LYTKKVLFMRLIIIRELGMTHIATQFCGTRMVMGIIMNMISELLLQTT